MIHRANVAFPRNAFPAFAVPFGISGSPRSQAIDVAVAHAENRGDQYGVVDFLVVGAFVTCALDIFGGDVLTALLYFAGYGEQRLLLVRDGRGLEVAFYLSYQGFVVPEIVSGGSSVYSLTKIAVVLGGDVGRDHFP